MFKLLADIVVQRRWFILVVAVVFAATAGYFGGPIAGMMTSGDSDLDDPASESVAAEERLAGAEDANPGADVVALVRVGEDARSPGARERVQGVAGEIEADPAVTRVLTFYETRDPGWVSEDGESTYVLAGFDPDADAGAAADRLRQEFASDENVTLGGGAIVGPQVGETVVQDLARAELLAFPILFATGGRPDRYGGSTDALA